MSIQSINPFNNQVIEEFDEFTDQQIDAALDKSIKAYDDWKYVPFEKRAAYMNQCADLLETNSESLAGVITMEMGKIKSESIGEIKKCAWVCRYYAENAERFLKEETLPVEEADSYIAYDPLGPVLAIMPWNFPFWQVFRFAAPNIMAGNTGILKHAANVPQCALEIEKLFRDSGFPEGVFRSILTRSSKMSGVIDDGRIKAVTLTGSDIAGRKVAENAGKNLKKTVLELGGSDPFIILGDADIEKAAETGVKARMINCGQSCIAAKRFILVKEIADTYLEKYRQLMSQMQEGDPWDDSTEVAPMAREDLRDELREQVDRSKELGAAVFYGDEKIEREGFFFKPTILNKVKQGMPAFDEELFGPVASVIVVEDEEEAIKTANQSKFGLGASLWTKDLEKARYMVRRIESGSVFVNAMVASHPKVPFGGVKASGYGRELSHLGIREFVNIKSVWIESA